MGRRWMRFLVALGFPFVLAAFDTTARADCVSECQASTYCDSTEGSSECARKLNDCYLSQCNRTTGLYGAIAHGAGSQAFGFAYDQPDAQAAARIVMANCLTHGEDCKIAIDFSNSCAAVAAGENGKFATGQGATRDEAQNDALATCAQNAGGSCDIKVWTCTKP